jgi:hypothetical protein
VTAETKLARALRVLDDLPDAELIEVASVIEDDAKKALERRDAVRGALLRRMHSREATALADADGCVAVELRQKRDYQWDSDELARAFAPRERDKYLKYIDPLPGRWVPKSATALNNLIQKLGNDPKAAQLDAARKVRVTESISFVGQD